MGFGGLAFLGAKLRGEGEDGFAALGVLGGDVHDEGGADVGEGSGIENLEGAVRLAFESKLFEARQEARKQLALEGEPHRPFKSKLFEARQEARFVAGLKQL